MNCINRFSSIAFAASLALSAAGLILGEAQAADKSPNSTKDDLNQAAVNAGCFIARDHGQSLEAGSCDLQVLQASANKGQVYAQNQMGLVSAMVTPQGTDIREARAWFEKAAKRGYAPAQVNLAVTYINGWGAAQNYGAALSWLNAAAKQKNSSAYANLGILYMNGWGVRRDYAEAYKYLELGAKAGDSGAASNLGYLYDGGLGVVQDYSAAARWYRTAAEKGNALGQNNLADLYLRGQGVPQSYPDAAYWFEKAAQQGHTGARIKLGFLLMHGMGIPKDSYAAYSWILAASKAGDHRGDEYLQSLQSILDQQKLAQATEHSIGLTKQSTQLDLRSSLQP